MRKVIEGLKNIVVLQHEDVLILRDYIRDTRPKATNSQRAAILANALHRIIEGSLIGFDETHRFTIRQKLLQRAAFNNEYNIRGDEVFRVILSLEENTEDYLDAFTNWVYAQQNVHLSQDTLKSFISKAKSLAAEFLEQDIHLILDRLEQMSALPAPKPLQPVNISNPFVPKTRRVSLLAHSRKYLAAAALLAAFVLAPFLTSGIFGIFDAPNNSEAVPAIEHNLNEKSFQSGLPGHLQYKPIEQEALKVYLKKKNSLLCEEPYFSAIIKAAKEFDINPLLLFAITGQEQAFVPKDHDQAQNMANNPFNVFTSWQKYNTNIHDTSRIAARTIANASKNRPPAEDPIRWINKKYAEDPNWWVGVSKIFTSLEKATTEIAQHK